MEPIISIVIPCYMQGRYLSDALDSLLSQTFQQWEAIIVNDGSTDETERVAKEYMVKDSRFNYLYQENSGVCAARNNGAKLACGKYQMALDADDKLVCDYIANAVDYLEQNPECSLYCGLVNCFGDKEGVVYLYWSGYASLLLGNSIFNGCVYRRKDFFRVGMYDENMRKGHDDWEFLIRLLYHNDNVCQVNRVTYYYRIENKRSNENLTKIMAKNRSEVEAYIFRKNVDKYLEYHDNPIKIYGEYLRLSQWSSRRFPTLLYKFMKWYQKLNDSFRGLLK